MQIPSFYLAGPHFKNKDVVHFLAATAMWTCYWLKHLACPVVKNRSGETSRLNSGKQNPTNGISAASVWIVLKVVSDVKLSLWLFRDLLICWIFISVNEISSCVPLTLPSIFPPTVWTAGLFFITTVDLLLFSFLLGGVSEVNRWRWGVHSAGRRAVAAVLFGSVSRGKGISRRFALLWLMMSSEFVNYELWSRRSWYIIFQGHESHHSLKTKIHCGPHCVKIQVLAFRNTQFREILQQSFFLLFMSSDKVSDFFPSASENNGNFAFGKKEVIFMWCRRFLE